MTKRTPEDRLNDPVLKHARTDFVCISEHQTIGEALAQLQHCGAEGRIIYIYVVNDKNQIKGVVPTRSLLLNPPEIKVADIMVRNLVTLPVEATLLDACEFFIFHRLLALPVVAKSGQLLGVVDVDVYTDEVSDLARREENEDIFQLIGVRLAQVRQASVPVAVSKRFPWLLCNIGGGLACALLAGWYEDVLEQVIVLALFIPVVLALAESVSIQSLTLTLQAQHGHRMQWAMAWRGLMRELPVGLLLGLAAGGLVASAAWLWQKDGRIALCILASIVLAVTTAAMLGLLVPTILRRVQRDPKVASGPTVLALTDILTLFYYLALAAWLLGP